MENREHIVGVRFKNGRATASVWAPLKERVELYQPEKDLKTLLKDEWGYWTAEIEDLKQGSLYQFIVDGDQTLPDPASLSQPIGVHGPSQALDITAYKW